MKRIAKRTLIFSLSSIEQRSKVNPQAQAAQTLAEQRKEKIRLECALLSLRLQREHDDTELLPTTEYLDVIRTFCRLSDSAGRPSRTRGTHYRVMDHIEHRHDAPS